MPLTPSCRNERRLSARRATSIVTLFTVLTLGLMALSAGPAVAAPAQGSYSMTLGQGSAGKTLKKAGVKFAAVKPSARKRLSGKRVRITSDLKSSARNGNLQKLRGGIKVSKGKRKLVLRKVSLLTSSNPTQIRATLGGKQIKLFVGKVKADVEPSTGSVTYGPSALKLTRRSAKLIKGKLRLKRLPVAKVGTLAGSYLPAFEDPYLDLCGLPATSISAPTYPEAAAPPAIGGVTTAGEPIEWGFKASFNGYVNGIGKIEVLDGVSKLSYPGPPNPAAPPRAFGFVFSPGEYNANGAGAADDQAVLNGTGSVMYCNQAHGFRITISDPTVVIDGASSRLIADVDTNISGDLTPARRVLLADLDLSAATITEPRVGEVQWSFPVTRPSPQAPATASAVTLSDDGSQALRLCEVNVPGAPPGCLYPQGTLLDALTVSAVVAPG